MGCFSYKWVTGWEFPSSARARQGDTRYLSFGELEEILLIFVPALSLCERTLNSDGFDDPEMFIAILAKMALAYPGVMHKLDIP